MLQTAYQALEAGDAARAESIARSVLDREPHAEGALLVLAFALDAQQRTIESLPYFEQLTREHPQASAHWNNLGNVQRSLGNQAGAEEAFGKALALDPQEASALFNLGLLRLDKGEPHAAREVLFGALRAVPDDAMVRATAANATFLCGNGDEADRLLADWQGWAGHDPLALAEVGWLYARLGQAADAERALDASANAAPHHPKILVRRAAFLERSNRVDEARRLLAQVQPQAAALEGLTEEVAIVRAEIAARGEDRDAARQQYEAIVADPGAARRHPELLTAIARLHDKSGDTAQVMAWLDRAHAVQVEEVRRYSPEWFEEGADPLGITRERITRDDVAGWLPIGAPSAEESPIFVVGFPRSGTTMLETMLDAHPALAGMDERTFLQDVVDQVRAAGLDYPREVGRIDDALAQRLRATYWNLVRTRAKVDPSRRLVDKNPLNILRLPLIRRLFPHAKIILALRHPCDVVLSNYMQTFRTPAYVALTASIASTARGYADTFDFWIDQAAALAPDVLELRYEDVVDDIDTQSRRIAAFLGLEWHEGMVNFHERAKARGYIATPSYHQVVEPINRKGVARWERYREHLASALPHLERFIDRWGYTTG